MILGKSIKIMCKTIGSCAKFSKQLFTRNFAIILFVNISFLRIL